jgi:hypothetical protein
MLFFTDCFMIIFKAPNNMFLMVDSFFNSFQIFKFSNFQI